MENGCLTDTGFPFGILENILEINKGGGAQHCQCTKCHRIVHFRMVSFMLDELHPN